MSSRSPRESGKFPRSRQEGASSIGTLPRSEAGAGVPPSEVIGPQAIVRINGSRAKLRVLEVKDGIARLVDSDERMHWRPVEELRRVP